MGLHALRDKQMYGNWSVLHPTGVLIFRCGHQRADWYLKRNLAVKLDDSTIQLTFEPKGFGHAGTSAEEYYLTTKKNQCVVCGSSDDLTKHHVVPHAFRKFFPIELRSRSSHDVLLVCIKHHDEYEAHASKLKDELFSSLGGNEACGISAEERDLLKTLRLIGALQREDSKIPQERVNSIRRQLDDIFGRPCDLEADAQRSLNRLNEIRAGRTDTRYQKVISTVEIDNFVKLWRDHFVSTMNPKFLPAGWSVDQVHESSGSNL